MSSRKHTVLTVLDSWCSVLQCGYPCPLQGRHDISGHVLYSGPPLLPTQPWLDIDGKWAWKLSPRNNAALPSVENPRFCQLAIPRSIVFQTPEGWLESRVWFIRGILPVAQQTRIPETVRSYLWWSTLPSIRFVPGTSTNLLNGHTTKVIAS